MKLRTQSSQANRPVLIEALESRELLSATTSVKVVSSAKTPVFGQSFTIKATVTSGAAKVKQGFVELFENKVYTGFREKVNSKGVASFSINAGDAFNTGTQAVTAHYVVNSKYAASTSKHINVTVGAPTDVVTASDGLKTAIITSGKGAKVVAGDTITYEDTGFDSKGNEVTETALFKPPTASFKVGANPLQTVKGLDEAVVGMQVGEVLDVNIPSSLAYGDGTTYELVIQLLSFTS
jgi:FKBP-type peptidyl-prolyl cis-trans isomerase